MPSLKRIALNFPRPIKRVIALGIDTVLCVVSVLLAYYLRLGYWLLPSGWHYLPIAVAVAVAIPLFVRAGLYRAIFRYSGRAALTSLVGAGAIYALIYAGLFTLIGIPPVPRTVGLIQPLLLIAMVGASRVATRFWLGEDYAQRRRHANRNRVLIYGAGQAGRQLAAALATSPDMRVIGFVDDDASLQGNLLNAKPVFGPEQLVSAIADNRINHVLLAMPSATRARRHEIISLLRHTEVQVRTLPGLNDIAHGRISTSDLRELDIEDLLGRETVEPNAALLAKCVTGKVVMITGAGGSIGSELARKVLAQAPDTLLLYEVSEPSLYAIHHELAGHDGARGVTIVPILGSVTDGERLAEVLGAWKIDTIYHAAAYKHVPLVEQNVGQGVYNNAVGTLRLAQAARSHGVKDVVLISTDKAVRPTSVMGASKRLAEMILQAHADDVRTTQNRGPRFSMVRFGNVLGSSGSVVPLFRKQIHAGGPVTITDREMTRYFMSIPEAAELVIQAGAMATGGEVFILEMGEPVKIYDLARNMIELSGLKVRDEHEPDGDIAIEVVGLRAGEKLYEELLISADDSPTAHPRILKAHEPLIPWVELAPRIGEIEGMMENDGAEAIVAALRKLIPEFKPDSGINDEVYRRHASAST